MFGMTTEGTKLNMEVQSPKDEEIKYSKPEQMSGIEYQLSRIADELHKMNDVVKLTKGMLKGVFNFTDEMVAHPEKAEEMDSMEITAMMLGGIKEQCGDLLKGE